MRLTGRGIAVAATGALLLAAGWWAGYPLLSALGAIGLGAVLAAVARTAPVAPVEVDRSVHPDRVERGRPALATLRIRNPGGRRRAGFLAVDPAGPTNRSVRVRGLPAGGEATHRYELPTGVRGRLVVGPLTLVRVDPFGLAVNRVWAGPTATLRVHPRRYPVRVAPGAYPRHHHEGSGTDRVLRGSSDLQDVREYVPGDDLRHLHWKATARTGALMVRELSDPDQPRFTVLLDTRAGVLTVDGFEEAVDLTASLLGAAAGAGRRSRLATSAGLDLTLGGGAAATRHLLDQLCELGQDGTPADPVVPGALASERPAGGALALITAGAVGHGPLARLRRAYPEVFLVALAGGPGPDLPAGVRLITADGAGQAVRRWNEAIR
ncbi:DUF58 domain-containing protein [Solwaraspora sp. WMMD1047]|uniref:DUF58 domain-containing protein n=1 Tax=Solwaraspora sp. WMMD1047 TaxID=3016102 RepID=UPI0024173CDE|nr:DUF58 domain-containing protein [Solwaraspora sp. WMMD1047]MDG4831857.1 DUF58 domain-containing protein [Solwaraspora sp. WMMD1047]